MSRYAQANARCRTRGILVPTFGIAFAPTSRSTTEAQMPRTFVSPETLTHTLPVPTYPEDLLPELQRVLAALWWASRASQEAHRSGRARLIGQRLGLQPAGLAQ